MPRSRTWVLSDLHLGPGTTLTTFREQDALARLLERLADDATPSELVLAGDTFDFLQCAGYVGFDAAKAVDRLEEILRGPGTSTVMTALAAYAARPGHEVTVLAGNHDPETLLADVRERFTKEIGRSGSVHFADEVLRRGDGERWPVWGRALGDPARPVWVAHGDRWDPQNAIDHDALRARVAAGQPVTLPVGSHLVFEVLAKLKPECRWVDELKPELSAVLPLLLYLDAPLTMRFLKKHWQLSTELLMGEVRGRVGAGELLGEAEEASAAEEGPIGALATNLARALPAAPDGRHEVDLAALEGWLEDGPDDALAGPTLASHRNPGRLLIRAWLSRVRSTDRFLHVDADDGVGGRAREAVPDDVHALVVGHTHGPRRRSALRPRYFNSGTWIPVAQVPPGDLRDWIDRLDANEGWGSTSPRSVVRVDVVDGEPSVALMSADEQGLVKEVR